MAVRLFNNLNTFSNFPTVRCLYVTGGTPKNMSDAIVDTVSNKNAKKRDIQWAEVITSLDFHSEVTLLIKWQGVRGIACILVVLMHVFNTFYYPEDSFDVPHWIWNLPAFRLLLHGGNLAVTIFFVISGYVCSIKPLKLARQGRSEEARKTIASSAFRRILRLGAPATVATIISCLVEILGGYNLLRTLPHRYSEGQQSLWSSIVELARSCVYPSSLMILTISFGLGIMTAWPGVQDEIGLKVFNGLLPTNCVDLCVYILLSLSHPHLPHSVELRYSLCSLHIQFTAITTSSWISRFIPARFSLICRLLSTLTIYPLRKLDPSPLPNRVGQFCFLLRPFSLLHTLLIVMRTRVGQLSRMSSLEKFFLKTVFFQIWGIGSNVRATRMGSAPLCNDHRNLRDSFFGLSSQYIFPPMDNLPWEYQLPSLPTPRYPLAFPPCLDSIWFHPGFLKLEFTA